jgi:hypothetical protein
MEQQEGDKKRIIKWEEPLGVGGRKVAESRSALHLLSNCYNKTSSDFSYFLIQNAVSQFSFFHQS